MTANKSARPDLTKLTREGTCRDFYIEAIDGYFSASNQPVDLVDAKIHLIQTFFDVLEKALPSNQQPDVGRPLSLGELVSVLSSDTGEIDTDAAREHSEKRKRYMESCQNADLSGERTVSPPDPADKPEISAAALRHGREERAFREQTLRSRHKYDREQ